MKKNNCIIEGSEKWIERVPDEYAIKLVETYRIAERQIFKFKFVKNCSGVVGKGFVEKCGIVRLPSNIGEFIEGIVICLNDLSEQPGLYYKNRKGLDYICQLNDCEIVDVVYRPLKFSKTIHYSEMNIERQKSDENAPIWLKEFARAKGANVAYFKF